MDKESIHRLYPIISSFNITMTKPSIDHFASKVEVKIKSKYFLLRKKLKPIKKAWRKPVRSSKNSYFNSKGR